MGADRATSAGTHPVHRARRFGGVARLYGDDALPALARAHVCVVGIGGVGSWTAEALARSGIGQLTLIDLDHVSESNVNRQVHALGSTLGASKVEAMAARIADISPHCRVCVVDDFVTVDNVEQVVPVDAAIVDAIDAPRAKAALIACARRRGQPIVVCGGAGGRTDPLRLRRDDLSRTRGDALLAAVRARLRREYGFPREAGKRFRVEALHSDEPLSRAQREAACQDTAAGGAPLNCAGYGSLVTVTAAMGLAAASWAIDRVLAASRVDAGRDGREGREAGHS
ncbi:MAG: tRNA threonylcarbamoyladenosine dehydratase [Burkholderiaceae bacterium]|nr:tRNA threonylcarbamoyladenosine dehydratase [Burkholderiaceae bacterium]